MALVKNKVEKSPQQPVASRTRRLSNHNCSGRTNDSITTLNSLTSRKDVTNDLSDITDARNSVNSAFNEENPQANIYEEITKSYEKDPSERTEDDHRILDEYAFMIPTIQAAIRSRQAKETLKQRVLEFEESLESVVDKVEALVNLIKSSRNVVIYTGAGVSTSASIPDYRGPNGLWTQIKRTGSFSITKIHDLTHAEPTLTHMAIKELGKRNIVKHIVTQNCDGLHLRSGIPQSRLSEIHGDMYIEVCPTCEKQYFRQADVTERTSRFRHKTGRKCHTCAEPNNNLIDTIVLYGERSRTKWPMNWERASKAAKRADLIICMGSSLKTLRRYSCLWPKGINYPTKKEPETKLVIINLQYTPKDKNAVLKINAKCDLVMRLVMQRMNIEVPVYDRTQDPLLKIATPFTPEERTELKGNLLFESRSSELPNLNGSFKRPKSESRSSPSLFVSELTDDPDKKRLKMRIRAVNVGATGSTDGDSNDQDGPTLEAITSVVDDNLDSEVENENQQINDPAAKIEYTIPGWLGKSLSSGKTSSYRRKKHGNKGRKHNVTAVAVQEDVDVPACS